MEQPMKDDNKLSYTDEIALLKIFSHGELILC